MVAVEADDGGGEDAAGVACVEDQGQAVAELLYDLICGGAGREAGEIGAGAGDGSADGFDDCGGDWHIRPAQSDAAGVAGDFQGQTVGGFDDEGQRAGPEFVRESKKCVGHIAN